jgi:hypothetical protein
MCFSPFEAEAILVSNTNSFPYLTAYGGGRRIGVEGASVDPQVAARKAAETAEALARFRTRGGGGVDPVGEKDMLMFKNDPSTDHGWGSNPTIPVMRVRW